MSETSSPDSRAAQRGLLLAAAVLPVILAYNTSPSTTFYNQALAVMLWSAVAWSLALGRAGGRQLAGQGGFARGTAVAVAPALAALAGVGLGVLLPGSVAWQAPSLAASGASLCAVAAVLLWAGQRAGTDTRACELAQGFFAGWVVAGLLSAAVALVQVFAPDLTDGDWIASSAVPGRAVGNLRQPNHLSSVLLWAAIALVGWAELRMRVRAAAKVPTLGTRPWGGVALGLCMAVLIWAVVLSASRTGLVGVVLLALWGLADRRLSRPGRALLLATPLMYAAAWWGMALWAQASDHAFGGQQRLSEGDVAGSRFRIWADALHLIAQHPWTGVGWGNFNFAWSLTPFPNRHPAFFDHTHNLPLQLAVELGVPLALLVCALLIRALWQAWRRALSAEPAASVAGRCAVMMVVLIGLHSLLEYPLWYAYFLLPAAWVWGLALGLRPAGAAAPGSRPAWLLAVAGTLCAGAAVLSVQDYLRVAAIFSARPGVPPLEQRIRAGQHSLFFAHHAHYAAATVSDTPAQELASFDIAAHHLLDTRLMMAWAQALAEAGDPDRARHLAQRLREFGNPASQEFFAVCSRARDAGQPVAPGPFQCQAPARAFTWEDFLPGRRTLATPPATAASSPAKRSR